MKEARKRLTKNCIICWNYLYLSQKLKEIHDPAHGSLFLDSSAHGSAVAWQHLNLLREYDVSDEQPRNSVEIRLQNLPSKQVQILGARISFDALE